MKARSFWSLLTAAFGAAIIAGETRFWHEETYSHWWRWLLGIEPKHGRRFVLVPMFTLLWAVFVPHILVRFLWVQSNKED